MSDTGDQPSTAAAGAAASDASPPPSGEGAGEPTTAGAGSSSPETADPSEAGAVEDDGSASAVTGADDTDTPREEVDGQEVDSDAVDEALAAGGDGDSQGDAGGGEEKVELHVDQEKLDAWDAIKDDYAVEVDGGPGEEATPTSPGDPDETQDAPG